MTLSYFDLEKENRDLKLLVKKMQEQNLKKAVAWEQEKKERALQMEDFKKEVRGIRSEAEKLAIHFSEVKQQRDRLQKELMELRGQLELVDEV